MKYNGNSAPWRRPGRKQLRVVVEKPLPSGEARVSDPRRLRTTWLWNSVPSPNCPGLQIPKSVKRRRGVVLSKVFKLPFSLPPGLLLCLLLSRISYSIPFSHRPLIRETAKRGTSPLEEGTSLSPSVEHCPEETREVLLAIPVKALSPTAAQAHSFSRLVVCRESVGTR